MGRSSHSRLRLSALSPLLAVASAISLSDFAPQLSNLPAQCNVAYTAQIPGCTASDFAANGACSSRCIEGLVQINNLVNEDCQGVDVPETSIIGLFEIGQGIQVLCDVEVVTSTPAQRTTPTTGPLISPPASIGKSTLVLSSLAAATSGLITDGSSSPSRTAPVVESSPPTTAPSTTFATNGQSPRSSNGMTLPTKTSTAAGEEESVKSGNTESGGGSPIDNINNSEGHKLSVFTYCLSSLLSTFAGGFILALR